MCKLIKELVVVQFLFFFFFLKIIRIMLHTTQTSIPYFTMLTCISASLVTLRLALLKNRKHQMITTKLCYVYFMKYLLNVYIVCGINFLLNKKFNNVPKWLINWVQFSGKPVRVNELVVVQLLFIIIK